MREDVLAAMRACRLLRGASARSLRRLAEGARVEQLPRGAFLFREGEAAERFAVVVSGKVRVYHASPDGRRITFETAGATDSVADVAALAGGRYPADADAVTPVTLAWLPREALLGLVSEEPALARTVVADLASRVVEMSGVMQGFALDVPQRLARYLFQRALSGGNPSPEGLEVGLGMPKGELAAALGTVPETLSRALARLRDDGVLTPKGRKVLIHDVGALARRGSGWEEG